MNDLNITKKMAENAMAEALRLAEIGGPLHEFSKESGLANLDEHYGQTGYWSYGFDPFTTKAGQNQRLLALAMVYTLGNDDE